MSILEVVAVSVAGLIGYSWIKWQEVPGVTPSATRIISDLLSINPGLEPEPFPAGVPSVKIWPRGIRNNNPGNIRYTGTQWQGLADTPTDGEYCIFINVRYGIRAMARILKSYAGRGLVTIESIISTWAPDSENNTKSYILAVSRRMGVGSTQVLTVKDWPALIEAVIHHENGVQPYPMTTIREGIALA